MLFFGAFMNVGTTNRAFSRNPAPLKAKGAAPHLGAAQHEEFA
jgi:hypothetical protein